MSATELLDRLRGGVGERYGLIREVGHGGMAVVFLATDLRHGRSVALKVLRPDIAAALGAERFHREIRIAARLQHPHILGLYDSGDVDGILYYTMPFVEGASLRQRMDREGPLSMPDAIRIACQVAQALAYAHRQNVVHRDIKPGNILLVGEQAIVADFGVARAVTEAAEDEPTRSGIAVGTPTYMSPEQASGDTRHVDGRADIYALGCVLYEMLAGEPPFGGRTAQAVLARHLHERPPSLQVVRPTTPLAVQVAVERALAKLPADRFSTAEEFAAVLEAASRDGGRAHPARTRARRRTVTLAALGLAGVLGWGLWQLVNQNRPKLDPSRVVVFPLRDQSPEDAGEGVATYIGYALEGTVPLRWLEAWDWLNESQRLGRGNLPATVAASISRAQRAGFYIDGAIVRGSESVTVVLRLHDVAGDSVVKRTGASAPRIAAATPQLGLQAVAELLPVLLEPGRRIDLSALAQRRPTAIADFLLGEREYRRMRFSSALGHYRRAVRGDSVFALAALKGAQAANWRELNEEAQELAGIALRSERWLPPRYARFALGLSDYLTGRGDSAIARFRTAVDLDPSWGEAWMALGESYYHLLPSVSSPDSLAEAAFLEAQRSDSAFTPPLFHLAEIAIRKGDIRSATSLTRRFLGAEPDSTLAARLELMLNCVQSGPDKVDWNGVVQRRPDVVLAASRLLSVGGAQAACAKAGFWAVFKSETLAPNQRWGALLGLQGMLTAQGRLDEVRRLLDSKAAMDLSGHVLYLIAASAGAGLNDRADEVADSLGKNFSTMGAPVLWALGSWAAHKGSVGDLRQIATALIAKADSSRTRRDSLLAYVMSAHAVLSQGDSATALVQLTGARPDAPLGDLEWQPWEALAGERITLAKLLLARKDYVRADQVAGQLLAPQPIIYLTYLPAMLALRIRAAQGLGSRGNAERLQRRLAALRMDSLPYQ